MSLPEELAEPAEQLERALSASVDVPQTLFEASHPCAVLDILLAAPAAHLLKSLLVQPPVLGLSLTAAPPAGY